MIKQTNKESDEQLKPAQEFSELETLFESEASSKPLQRAQQFDDEMIKEPELNRLFEEVDKESTVKNKKPWSKLARWSLLSLLTLVCVENWA